MDLFLDPGHYKNLRSFDSSDIAATDHLQFLICCVTELSMNEEHGVVDHEHEPMHQISPAKMNKISANSNYNNNKIDSH